MAGLEPAQLAPLTPQASVSTSSTTSAIFDQKIDFYCFAGCGTSAGRLGDSVTGAAGTVLLLGTDRSMMLAGTEA